ncbi:MAG TPA: ABC transporter ATP-binding protein [Bacteroidales bacterium]|nr:ABC transporter ATP-binding protein [Bacteroidales bacterium]HOR60325.1 ABC transporter ATP-binding protein [Bacteroidales bacterium]HPL04788.1 ABC transporter ATP-binding protein [Bacteroidales bacterium]
MIQHEKAIVIKDLNKKYYKKKQSSSNLFKNIKSNNNAESFFALKNINLEINKGEIIGIIGPNGAGKSTLLKILAEVTPPTSGKIEINGKIASILEIGIGFQPDLSGYENIFLSGRLYGLSKKQIKSKLEQIIEMFGFADFINTPVKYYSSGMYMRLAFAIITNIEADIYLFDEVLSVGDLGFQSKVIKELEKLKNNGATILIVTHLPISIYQICNKMVLLNLGQIYFEGAPNKATLLFKEILDKNRDANISISNSINEQSLKTIKKSEISSEIADFNLSNFSISNSLDNITKTINYDKDIYIKLKFSYYFPEDVNIILTLVDVHWNIISTHYIKMPPSKKIIEKEITLLIEKNTLNEIKLMFSLIVANLNGELIISYKDLLEIKLVGNSNISKLSGYVNLPIKIIN